MLYFQHFRDKNISKQLYLNYKGSKNEIFLGFYLFCKSCYGFIFIVGYFSGNRTITISWILEEMTCPLEPQQLQITRST
jgi:hypothetical protein